MQLQRRPDWPLDPPCLHHRHSAPTATSLKVLHKGPYLSSLRHLNHWTHGGPPLGALTWHLPAALATAASLELLNLGHDSALRLRGAEHAALLRALPQLRRVLLPIDAVKGYEAAAAAAAVDSISEGLQEGSGPGAGPLHAVEVEGVVLGLEEY